jgi:hypothetical protein
MSEQATGHELEQLKRKIFVLRSRGMAFRQIAAATDKAVSTVHKHYKSICRDTTVALEGAGQQEILGEMALFHKELVQEGLRNLTQVEAGSPMRANWTSITGKRLDAWRDFMFLSGLMHKAADKLELNVKDVRKMSDEEIERDIAQLQNKLALSPVKLGDRLVNSPN